MDLFLFASGNTAVVDGNTFVCDMSEDNLCDMFGDNQVTTTGQASNCAPVPE